MRQPKGCPGDLLGPSGYELVKRWGWASFFQELGSKTSFSTSFIPGNPKYCLSTPCRVEFETCNPNFSDSQLQGNILIRQMRSRKKSNKDVNRQERQSRHRRRAGGTADTTDLGQDAKYQVVATAQARAPPSQFIQGKLAWSMGRGRVGSTVFDNKSRKGR